MLVKNEINYTYVAVSNRISKKTTVQGDISKIADIAKEVSVDSQTQGDATDSTSATSTGTVTTETVNDISLVSETEKRRIRNWDNIK